MNAVEIADAIADLFAAPIDAAEFPYAFLQAFGNKETTIRRLRTGDGNKSDVGGVLQRTNIHLAVAPAGEVGETLAELRESPATTKHKVKFILATDGDRIEAEAVGGNDTVSCDWADFPDHFGMFLPLAGISTVREIRENTFDIRATARLNKLYVALLRENPDWGTDERRPDLNHFFARLIFCYFAEDTGIFADQGLFTETIRRMSAADSTNTHEVVATLFRAMNTKHTEREAEGLPRWAAAFPYVNGGLFSGSMDVPTFSRSARGYLLQVGTLDWKQINPDIFGSMIQAVADDEERGALGMHYTSVPNILKVLNPLFLDDLRAKLEEAGENSRKLLNLRNRIRRIRVFDPACGSGNFLVIAYKEMRALEHEINRRRGESGRASKISLKSFRGIELRNFAAEVARLALIIAEFQCDVLYRGQQEALNDFLPLDAENWITCGNALRLDWLSLCPPTGTGVRLIGEDLFSTPLEQPEIDFENAGGETYICGNPPYLGKGKLTGENKSDMAHVFRSRTDKWGYIDLVGAWFVRASDYCRAVDARAALVSTNSVTMGRQAIDLWPIVLADGITISFAHTAFYWSNNASRNAAVSVVIIGLEKGSSRERIIYSEGIARTVSFISHYLTAGVAPLVRARTQALSPQLPAVSLGNKPNDGQALRVTFSERQAAMSMDDRTGRYLRPFVGSDEHNSGTIRYCLWIADTELAAASQIPFISARLDRCRQVRQGFQDSSNRSLADRPHQMREFNASTSCSIIIPISTSERRAYIPAGLVPRWTIVSSQAFAIHDPELWALALLVSRMHLVWIAVIGGKFKLDYRYTNDLGWNTFPVPTLTEQNKVDLTQCVEEVLLAREMHYPKTIAELYDPEKMPANLREAHERNDEVLERIYIGRRFRNDTERLESLFQMYTMMTSDNQRPTRGRSARQ